MTQHEEVILLFWIIGFCLAAALVGIIGLIDLLHDVYIYYRRK